MGIFDKLKFWKKTDSTQPQAVPSLEQIKEEDKKLTELEQSLPEQVKPLASQPASEAPKDDIPSQTTQNTPVSDSKELEVVAQPAVPMALESQSESTTKKVASKKKATPKKAVKKAKPVAKKVAPKKKAAPKKKTVKSKPKKKK